MIEDILNSDKSIKQIVEESINESSLSRVWQHTQEEGNPFGMMTAFRGEYSYDQNVIRNLKLKNDIRDLKYGFFYVDGYYIENEGTPNEKRVSEDSFFIVGSKSDNDGKLRGNMIMLAKKYNQETVLVKDIAGINLWTADGEKVLSLPAFKPNEVGEIYTQLRNKSKRPFRFENIRPSHNKASFIMDKIKKGYKGSY